MIEGKENVNSKELIKQGKLQEARAELVAALKHHPGDIAARTLLFQVLLFSGEWDKTRQHLEVLANLASDKGPAMMQYLSLLHCEQERLQVLGFQTPPSYLPGTPDYFQEVYPCFLPGSSSTSAAINRAAAEQIPQVSGTVNGQEFSGLRNGDDLLAHALEVFAHDRYLWVPFESIREILITPPQNLLDLLWISASVTTWSGLSLNGMLPVLYPFSWQHADAQVRMGRMTDWAPQADGLVRGAGQQLFLFGEQDLPLLEVREVRFTMTAGAAPQTTASRQGDTNAKSN